MTFQRLDTYRMLILILLGALCAESSSEGVDLWHPTSLIQCRSNSDCKNPDVCCSVTPAFGRRREIQERQIPPNWDGMVHYCLPWKNENATWCELRVQYSQSTSFYNGLCPCGPGLQCLPTDKLDPKAYPRDRYGKCVPVA